MLRLVYDGVSLFAVANHIGCPTCWHQQLPLVDLQQLVISRTLLEILIPNTITLPRTILGAFLACHFGFGSSVRALASAYGAHLEQSNLSWMCRRMGQPRAIQGPISGDRETLSRSAASPLSLMYNKFVTPARSVVK